MEREALIPDTMYTPAHSTIATSLCLFPARADTNGNSEENLALAREDQRQIVKFESYIEPGFNPIPTQCIFLFVVLQIEAIYDQARSAESVRQVPTSWTW